jgi:hypothetical protein
MSLAESTRIRLLSECLQKTVPNTNLPAPGLQCPPQPPLVVQQGTTQNCLSHTLGIATVCPITYAQPNLIIPCIIPDSAPSIPPFPEATEGPQGPAATTVTRKFSRIPGIDVICKPVTGASRAGSLRTSQIRATINAQTNNNRYPLTVLPVVPYPQFIPRASGPQPGVPIAPLCTP